MSKYALFVHDNPGFGGVDHITAQLVTGLQARGWVVEHWNLRRQGLDALRLALRVIRHRGIVVATQNFSAAYATALLAALCRRPWVMWVHGPVLDVLRVAGTGAMKRAWLQWLYRRTKVVVCSSGASQQSLFDFCGRDRAKALRTEVIRNTAAPAFLDAPRAARPWGRDLGFVGRLSAEKRPLVALQVLQALPASYRLHVIGDGPLMDALKAAGAKEIDQGRLILAGRQAITPQTYRQWDVTLLCSTYEGYPLVPLESLASGIPVACSPIPAAIEMLGTDAPYMLARDHTPASLARVVEELSQRGQAEVAGDIGRINEDHDPGEFVRHWNQLLTDGTQH